MQRISRLEGQIRDYVNDRNLFDRHFRSRMDEWNTLCVAMDTLGDTCGALQYHETHGIGEGEGEKYLHLYGFLQSVFLQQDAIHHLYKCFVDPSYTPNNESAWRQIRELRNLTVGHPIEVTRAGTIRRCFISRIALRTEGFTCLIWNNQNEETEFQDVDLDSLYSAYKTEAISVLDETHQAQIARWGGS